MALSRPLADVPPCVRTYVFIRNTSGKAPNTLTHGFRKHRSKATLLRVLFRDKSFR